MIHVITAVHNRCEITEEFINSLLRQTYKNIHLIIVDDGSTDGTEQMIARKNPNATILKGDGNLWWGGAMHIAYKWIKKNADMSDLVLFSNDDVIYNETYIENGIAHLMNHLDAFVSGMGISLNSQDVVDLPIVWDFSLGSGQFISTLKEKGNCSSTRSLFCTVATVIDVGGFHPILIPHYLSDYAWTIKGAKKGHGIYCFEDLKYKFDLTTTGFRDRKEMSIKQIFSKKSNINPIYRITYLCIVTPISKLPIAIYNQVRRIN